MIVQTSVRRQGITYAATLIVGAATSTKAMVMYLQILEFATDKKKKIYTSVVFTIDSLNQLAMVLFIFLFRNGYIAQLVGLVITLLGLCLAIYLPETPQFLYQTGDADKLRMCFSRIAKFN